jgi:hypothetical protein
MAKIDPRRAKLRAQLTKLGTYKDLIAAIRRGEAIQSGYAIQTVTISPEDAELLLSKVPKPMKMILFLLAGMLGVPLSLTEVGKFFPGISVPHHAERGFRFVKLLPECFNLEYSPFDDPLPNKPSVLNLHNEMMLRRYGLALPHEARAAASACSYVERRMRDLSGRGHLRDRSLDELCHSKRILTELSLDRYQTIRLQIEAGLKIFGRNLHKRGTKRDKLRAQLAKMGTYKDLIAAIRRGKAIQPGNAIQTVTLSPKDAELLLSKVPEPMKEILSMLAGMHGDPLNHLQVGKFFPNISVPHQAERGFMFVKLLPECFNPDYCPLADPLPNEPSVLNLHNEMMLRRYGLALPHEAHAAARACSYVERRMRDLSGRGHLRDRSLDELCGNKRILTELSLDDRRTIRLQIEAGLKIFGRSLGDNLPSQAISGPRRRRIQRASA